MFGRAARAPRATDRALRRSTVALWLLIPCVLFASLAAADDVRPVQIQILEQEPGVFQLDWQAPPQLPRQAIPRIVLPASCTAESEP